MKSIFDDDKKNPSFGDKCCAFCGTPLHRNAELDYCDHCRELALFHDVKDFIRENDVNEFQVASHFGIPLRVVKGWIKEGRIEYKETPAGKKAINNKLTCERCGSPVSFGSLCPKCLKLLNQKQGYGMQNPQEDDRMFFLDASSDKKRK